MRKRKLVTAKILCETCGRPIVASALIDESLTPFLQTGGLCAVCQERREDSKKSGTTEREFAQDVFKKIYGFDIHIPPNDPDPWWYVVG